MIEENKYLRKLNEIANNQYKKDETLKNYKSYKNK